MAGGGQPEGGGAGAAGSGRQPCLASTESSCLAPGFDEVCRLLAGAAVAVLLELVAQGALRNAEALRCPRLIAVLRGEGFGNGSSFERRDARRQAALGPRLGAALFFG